MTEFRLDDPAPVHPWTYVLNQGPLLSHTQVLGRQGMLHLVPSPYEEHAATVAATVVPGSRAPDFVVYRGAERFTLADFRGAPLVVRLTRASDALRPVESFAPV